MHYLKRNTRFSILAFLIIVLSITISISTLAKTEVYFSLYDNPQKESIKNINQAEAFINIAMYVFPPPAQKIIALREELGGFKEPQNLTQLPKITNLEWEEWKEEGIVIIID
jgi:DNA uptake protein ComE-like DNA-binding protein